MGSKEDEIALTTIQVRIQILFPDMEGALVMSNDSQTLATNHLTSSAKKDAFIKREDKKSKLTLLNEGLAERMREAQQFPDALPGSVGVDVRPAPETPHTSVDATVGSPEISVARAPFVAVRDVQPAPVPPRVEMTPVVDSASVSVPEPVVRAVKPPRRVEKSFSLDKNDYDYIARAARTEAMRLDRQVPISEILRHMIAFAIAHAENNCIVPTDDGFGLHIRQR